jgi:hypothetical protein
MAQRAFLAQHIRYTTWALCALFTLLSAIALLRWGGGWWVPLGAFGALTLLGWRDHAQTRHAVLRNYPVLGHMRFLLEFIRPEIRQYFIEGDNEAASPSRARSAPWSTSAPRASPTSGPSAPSWTGAKGYEWINHSLQTTKIDRTTSASGSAPRRAGGGRRPAPSPTAPACSTSRR